MESRKVIWTPAVREKLSKFRSEHFTLEETLDFIHQTILETEELLKNDIVTRTYTEELGSYQGLSRVVIKKFQVYYKTNQGNVFILAVLFPGER